MVITKEQRPATEGPLRRADFAFGPAAGLRKRVTRAARFLLSLLGLLVVYVTMSLALVALAPAVGLR